MKSEDVTKGVRSKSSEFYPAILENGVIWHNARNAIFGQSSHSYQLVRHNN